MKHKKIKIEIIVFRYVNKSYEYLLLKRIESKGGFWQPLTGGVEKEENLNQALTRELWEETGITKHKRILKDF